MLHLHYIDCHCKGTGEWTAPDGSKVACDAPKHVSVEASEWMRCGRPATANEYLAIQHIHAEDVLAGRVEEKEPDNTGFTLTPER